MRKIDTTKLSNDECWGIQINGTRHCQNCKWTGLSACVGKNIILTGRNSKGYFVGETGLVEDDYVAPGGGAG
ncbi:MAG: hypothetical protein KAG99_02610 [Bacteroidales bacterium]|nr:hypothetical protein [Bacteroidales bacterium]